MSISPSIRACSRVGPSVALSVCVSLCLSRIRSAHLSIYLSIYLSVYLYNCLSVYLSIYLSNLSIFLAVCLLSIHPSTFLYVYVCAPACVRARERGNGKFCRHDGIHVYQSTRRHVMNDSNLAETL